jgi:hypothetical protein
MNSINQQHAFSSRFYQHAQAQPDDIEQIHASINNWDGSDYTAWIKQFKIDYPHVNLKKAKQVWSKREYRTKQNLIRTVHANLQDYLRKMRLLADANFEPNSDDVLRVKVMNTQNLNDIATGLRFIQQTYRIAKVHLKIIKRSKNHRLMKGFYVYLKLERLEDMQEIKQVFIEHKFRVMPNQA